MSIKITTAADRIRADGLAGMTSKSEGLSSIQRAALRAQEATQNLEPYASVRTGTASGVSSNGMGASGAQRTSAPGVGDAGSAIAKAAASASPTTATPSSRSSEIYQSVNEDTDTVFGQLKKHTDFSSPVMQRVAQQAKNAAAARGLSNSSIAIGNATGAVIDKAGEFATTDAGFYNNRKTENQRAATHLESTRMNNATQIKSAQIGANAQITAAGISANATIRATQIQNEGRLELQAMQDKAAMDRLELDTSSRESIEKYRIEQSAIEAEKDRLSREFQTQYSADNQYQIAQMQQEAQNDRTRQEIENDIWSDYNTGVINIDQNASAASQREQLQRLNDTTKIRLEAVGAIDEALGMAPAVQPNQTVFQGTMFGGQSLFAR